MNAYRLAVREHQIACANGDEEGRKRALAKIRAFDLDRKSTKQLHMNLQKAVQDHKIACAMHNVPSINAAMVRINKWQRHIDFYEKK